MYSLKEDNLPSKIPVRFSSKIDKDINEIKTYNKYNIDAISQWIEYLEDIKKYISNPVIAFDYTNRFIKFPNGTKYIRDFGYNVGYSIIADGINEQPCVYVFMVNLKTEEFGLKRPPVIQESKKKRQIVIKESQLHSIIHKTIRRLFLRA